MSRILIIDDDAQILKMLRQILEREKYHVTEASNGKEGLRLYRENPADLVITDIIMPEKEGIEIIIELKRDYPDVKIIAISGGGRINPEDYLDIAKKEIIIELKRDYPDVKIIAISGGGRINPEDYLDIAKKLGAHRIFAKPVERKELLNAVRELLVP